MDRQRISRFGQTAIDLLLAAVITIGIVRRIAAIPTHVADSGDEWGNTTAPFRILLEGGDPQTFFHPSLYYDVVAFVYALWFQFLKFIDVAGDMASMTDLFVQDVRYFVIPARIVSGASAILTIWAVYRLAHSLWDRRAGLTAAALLAASPLHLYYSKTVRVDSLAVLMVVWAIAAIAKIPQNPSRWTYDRAGLMAGLATSANYSGALSMGWLFLADAASRMRGTIDSQTVRPSINLLLRAFAVGVITFLFTSPFIVLNFETFSRDFGFIAGLAAQEHVGWEGRDVLFYVRHLAETNSILAVLIALGTLVTLLVGNTAQRLVGSFPLAYLAVFSLIRSKDARFILPALPLFLVVAGGLPHFIGRRLDRAPVLRLGAITIAYGLVFTSLYTMLVHPAGAPDHTPLRPPDEAIFEWLENNSRSGSKIVVESGVVLFLDTLGEEEQLAHEIRRSMVRVRPGLDHEYIGAIYIGGNNYDPTLVTNHAIDYAIISRRTVRNIGQRCDEFPKVCEFHRLLREEGELVFETPDGIEGAFIFELERDPDFESPETDTEPTR